MNRPDSLRFACRVLLPGLAWVAIVLVAGCSSNGDVASESAGAPKPGAASAKGGEPAKPPANPMPLDVYASAMVPRWYVPSGPPDRPAFTPHWYTPSVDPLFRHRAPSTGPREGAPSESDERATAQGPARDDTPGTRRAPAPDRSAATGGHADSSLKDFDVIEPLLSGVASWYGPGFHGKHTASGEIYDQHRMTAAHPSLPMGTIIRVENEANGHVVWVRVNDRGPYKKGRVLDLSRAAAERLGMVDDGTAPVRISVLRWPRSTDTELGLRAYTQYVVQVAAYPEPDKAEGVLQDMQQRFAWAPFMLDPRPNGVLSIVAGPYDDGDDAQRAARRLQRSGVTSLVRRYRK